MMDSADVGTIARLADIDSRLRGNDDYFAARCLYESFYCSPAEVGIQGHDGDRS
jgi:hypothetical protein